MNRYTPFIAKRVTALFLMIACFISFCGCRQIDYIKEVRSGLEEEVTVVEPAKAPKDSTEQELSYSTLNSSQKKMYRILYSAADDMLTGWIYLGEYSKVFSHDASLAYRALMYDNPDFFWLSRSFFTKSRQTWKEKEGLIALSINEDGRSCDYLVSKEDCELMRAILKTAINTYTSALSGSHDNFSNEIYIHDRLCRETNYLDRNADSYDLASTAYGALVGHKAVCEGYARALQLICKNVGIPCIPVYGEARGEKHMWNLINPGDGWYHIDITWDDKEEPLHTYFNLTQKEILKNHKIYKTYSEANINASLSDIHYNFFVHLCENEFLNYYKYNKKLLEKDMTKAAEALYKAYKNKEKYVELLINDPMLLLTFDKAGADIKLKLQWQLYNTYGYYVPVISEWKKVENTVVYYF